MKIKKYSAVFYEWINKLTEWFCYLLLTVLLGIVFIQVFLRYVFRSPVSWSEEVALLLLVWFGMLSVAVAIYRHTHMAISVIWDRLRPSLQLLTNIAVEFLILFFALNISINAGLLIDIVGDQTLSASGIPRSWLYYPLQAGGGLMAINAIGNLLLDHFPGKDAEPSSIESP